MTQHDAAARLAAARRALAEAESSATARAAESTRSAGDPADLRRPIRSDRTESETDASQVSTEPGPSRGTTRRGRSGRRTSRPAQAVVRPDAQDIEPAAPEDEELLPPDPQSAGQDADPEAVARQIVLRQLTMAPRSRAQLRDKLRSRGCDDEVAERVLDRFTEVGLVDDAAFAEVLVRSQQTARGLSRRGLAHELTKKGVDREVADAALADVDDEDERARAERLVAARLPRLHGLPRDVQTRRLGGWLARKGYPAGLSYGVIREALDASAEHTRD